MVATAPYSTFGFTITLFSMTLPLATLPTATVGQSFAEKNQFPWMARISVKFSSTSKSCGASLIEKQWLLTAAHCVMTIEKTSQQLERAASVIVRLGINDISIGADQDEQHLFQITNEIYVHDNYNSDNLEFDFALIKLTSPLNFSDGVKPIALPLASTCRDSFYTASSQIIDSCTNAVALGWGSGESGTTYFTSSILKSFTLKLSMYAKCQQILNPKMRDFSDSKICAISASDNLDMCGGDEGSPLFCRDTNSGFLMLVGIASHAGHRCNGYMATPGVYSRVCKALEWIKSLTKPATAKQTIKKLVDGCPVESLPSIPNGYIEISAVNSFGSVRKVICNEGFNLVGNSNVVCGKHGVWAEVDAECTRLASAKVSVMTPPLSSMASQSKIEEIERQCMVVDYISNGRLTSKTSNKEMYFGDMVDPGTMLTVICNDGFIVLAGNEKVTCLYNGLWSSQVGFCYRGRRNTPITASTTRSTPLSYQQTTASKYASQPTLLRATSTIFPTATSTSLSSPTTTLKYNRQPSSITAMIATSATSITPGVKTTDQPTYAQCTVPRMLNGYLARRSTGAVVAPGTRVNAISHLILTCNKGFRLVLRRNEVDLLSCFDDGEWSVEPLGSCQLVSQQTTEPEIFIISQYVEAESSQ